MNKKTDITKSFPAHLAAEFTASDGAKFQSFQLLNASKIAVAIADYTDGALVRSAHSKAITDGEFADWLATLPPVLGEEGTNDAAIIERADLSVRHRRSIELKVVRCALRELLKDGYEIAAIDDGEECTAYATEREQIDAIFGVDESYIITKKDGKESYVFIVLGNDGYDAISDYGMSLDPSMQKVNDYADKLEKAGA